MLRGGSIPILAGNGVTEAAAEAGITRLRVIEADGNELIAVRRSGLTPAQKRALAIYDNRTSELASWNLDQLHADLASGLSLQPFWSEEEAKLLLAQQIEPHGGLTDPDEVPAERATDIQVGDLFELGRHRLLCGRRGKAALKRPGRRSGAHRPALWDWHRLRDVQRRHGRRSSFDPANHADASEVSSRVVDTWHY